LAQEEETMSKQIQEAYIVAATRTPIGRSGRGYFRNTRPDDLLIAAMRHALTQVPTLDPKAIEDAIIGCSFPEAEQGMNMARAAMVLAGLPQTVAGVTVNLESVGEMRRLADISAGLGVRARGAIRINPLFELRQSGMRMGGGPKQFGIDAELLAPVLQQIGRLGLAFEGFHLFAGSQNLRAESICEAQLKSYELALRLHDRVHYRGVATRERADEVQWREEIDAVLQRSEEAFPATSLGL